MHLRDDELRGLRVETTDGDVVGRLVGFVVDTDGCAIAQFRVRPLGLLAYFSPSRELLVSAANVVSLDDRRMVIVSGSVSARTRAARMLAPANQPQGAAMDTQTP